MVRQRLIGERLTSPPAIRTVRFRWPSGLRLVVTPLRETRAVAVRLYLTGGARAEPEDLAGVAHFVEHAVFRGTARWPTSRELSVAIEGVGGAADAFTDKDHSGFIITGPVAHLDLFLQIMADLVQAPRFDPAEIERERGVILEELRSYGDDADDLAKTTLENLLWPDHPLGREIAGSPETVQAITREHLLAYMRAWFVPAGAVLSVAGPVVPVEVRERVTEAFRHWNGGALPAWTPAPPPAPGPAVRVLYRHTEQARLRLGFPVASRHAPGRHALEVLATLLAGAAISRLERRLREDLGLVYEVSATLEQYDDAGLLSLAVGVAPGSLVAAVRAMLQELAALREEVPAEEVRQIVEYLCGRWLCAEGTDFYAAFVGRDEQVFGRPSTVAQEIAALRAVTVAEVRQLAAQTFRPERTFLTVVGPWRRPALLRQLLAQY